MRLIKIFNNFEQTVLTLQSTQPSSNCPNCQTVSNHVHSYYTRQLQDLPWVQQQLGLILKARRFYCYNRACPKLTFAENFGQTIEAYARRTKRCAVKLSEIARIAGGQAGAELAQLLAIPVSRDTLLRLFNKLPTPPVGQPRVVSVDDWAWKKGQRYGTLIVDLEQHRPLDLLPDRNAQSVADWLVQYPSIEVVSRDRGQMYIEGVKRGAPQAQAVTDRWHLLKNLSEHLQKFLATKTNLIRQITSQFQSAKTIQGLRLSAEAKAKVPKSNLAPKPPKSETVLASGRVFQVNQQRLNEFAERFEQVHALKAHKVPIAHIARQLNLSRMTVYKYLALKEPPGATPLPFEQVSPRGTRMLDPFVPYLLSRWQQGYHNASQLWQEIRPQGFNGARKVVEEYLVSLSTSAVSTIGGKGEMVRPLESEQTQALVALATARKLPKSAYQAVWLFTRNQEELAEWEQHWLLALNEADEKLAQTYEQVQTFVRMVRQHNSEPLRNWLCEVEEGGVAQLKSFAKGLAKDYEAVEAGLRLVYSQGQTEGQVDRLKYLKRQMYGRAKFRLLRARVLQRKRVASKPGLLELERWEARVSALATKAGPTEHPTTKSA